VKFQDANFLIGLAVMSAVFLTLFAFAMIKESKHRDALRKRALNARIRDLRSNLGMK
jgi:hypothetical protein